MLPGAAGSPLNLLGSPPAVSGANSVLSQLALAGHPAAFNPLGLSLPGAPGAPPGGRPMSKNKWHFDIKRRSLTFDTLLQICKILSSNSFLVFMI